MDDVHVLGPANGSDIQPCRRFLDLSSATRRVATERGAEAPSHKRAASAAMASWKAALGKTDVAGFAPDVVRATGRLMPKPA